MPSYDAGSSFPALGESWLLAPTNAAPIFSPRSRISLALQQILRANLPAMYFANTENFRDTKKAYPMLLYQASRPFCARMRTELTYDLLNPASLGARVPQRQTRSS
jgi:hypothetical protein